MRVVVLGATGRIGAPLATELERRGHEVVRASRSSGVDALTGRGLDEAFEGAEVLVDALHVQTIARKPAVAFFETTAQNAVAAAKRAGVRHLVLVSIWHANHPDAKGYGYYVGKAEQERVYESSGLPVTVVRSAQWYELAEMLLDGVRIGPFAIVPHMLARPLAADAAALAVADVAEGGPRPDGVVVAGPERHDLAELARRIAAARGGRPRVLSLNPPGMGVFAKGLLLPPEDVPGVGPTFSEWLASRSLSEP